MAAAGRHRAFPRAKLASPLVLSAHPGHDERWKQASSPSGESMDARETPAPRAITRTSSEHGDAMLSARGAFDRDNRNELISVVEASFADGHRTVMLDVSQVTFIDASVVNALVNCEEDARAQGRTLRLLNPGPATAQILIDTGTFTALCGYR